MTHHFVNLVSWKYFAFNVKPHRKIHVDSLTLKMMFRLFGRNTERLSGVGYFGTSNFPEKTIFLTSSSYNSKYCYVLPFWKTIHEIILTADIKAQIKDFQSIVIGISSPKQDYLADLIVEHFPNKEVFCLGAAIYEKKTAKWIDNLGLNWFTMMVKNPQRFLKKIYITFRSANRIIFSKKERILFRSFMEISR